MYHKCVAIQTHFCCWWFALWCSPFYSLLLPTNFFFFCDIYPLAGLISSLSHNQTMWITLTTCLLAFSFPLLWNIAEDVSFSFSFLCLFFKAMLTFLHAHTYFSLFNYLNTCSALVHSFSFILLVISTTKVGENLNIVLRWLLLLWFSC